MIDVSMITMNWASAMTARAVQRRGFAVCMGVPFLGGACGVPGPGPEAVWRLVR